LVPSDKHPLTCYLACCEHPVRDPCAKSSKLPPTSEHSSESEHSYPSSETEDETFVRASEGEPAESKTLSRSAPILVHGTKAPKAPKLSKTRSGQTKSRAHVRNHNISVPAPNAIASWGVTQVCEWLDEQGLAELHDSFAEHAIDGAGLWAMAETGPQAAGIEVDAAQSSRLLIGLLNLRSKFKLQRRASAPRSRSTASISHNRSCEDEEPCGIPVVVSYGDMSREIGSTVSLTRIGKVLRVAARELQLSSPLPPTASLVVSAKNRLPESFSGAQLLKSDEQWLELCQVLSDAPTDEGDVLHLTLFLD